MAHEEQGARAAVRAEAARLGARAPHVGRAMLCVVEVAESGGIGAGEAWSLLRRVRERLDVGCPAATAVLPLRSLLAGVVLAAVGEPERPPVKRRASKGKA